MMIDNRIDELFTTTGLHNVFLTRRSNHNLLITLFMPKQFRCKNIPTCVQTYRQELFDVGDDKCSNFQLIDGLKRACVPIERC